MDSWHSKTAAQALKDLDSRPAGLAEQEAAARRARWGPNALAAPPGESLLRRVLTQLRDPMILVLLAAAGVSILVGEKSDWLDGVIILLIVAVNSTLSILQEDKADRALKALQQLAAPQARVLRQGSPHPIPAEDLVPGDIVVLEAGDQIPADARLLECSRLQVDESALTGESVPVEKKAQIVLPESTVLGDRENVVLSGTLVTAGRGTALVFATGMHTQMGHIADLLADHETPQTPLQRKMAEISKSLSFLCLSVCAILFGIGLLQGRAMLPMFLTAVALAVAAIPEGLPAIVTIVLSLGVGRMAQRGAIIKKLPAVETLGSAGVICSDKTGTLTQNRMTVQQLWTPPGGDRQTALLCAALCSDARLMRKAGSLQAQGDPTESALVVAAAREGVHQGQALHTWPRIADLPFDSNRKRMSTLHRRPDGGYRLFVKGAPDALLPLCTATPAGAMTPARRQLAEHTNVELAGQALRVLGVAYRDLDEFPDPLEPNLTERRLTFLGLFGLMDPPRPEAAQAVAQCLRAGIRPVMITGDHKVTALAVARQLGLYRKGDLALTGTDLDFLPQPLLEQEVEKCSVFARVTPEHKLRIVRAWQARNQVVAMTGDGVNDAPALKAADIGCAMGQSGTDVAKGAAHMILTDDNFSTLVCAVEEGRATWANIRKAVHYLLSCNLGEIFTLFTATLLDFGQMPLVPVQLLWLNLVTDSLPALALGMEPLEEGTMDEPPRPADAPLFDRPFTFRLLTQGLMVGALTLAAYFLGLLVLAAPGLEGAVANTMAFSTLTLCQLFHAFNVRSETRSLFSLGLSSNPAMLRAFFVGLALQGAVLFVPPLRSVFSVTALTGQQLLVVLALAAAPIPLCELGKHLRHRRSAAVPEMRAPRTLIHK